MDPVQLRKDFEKNGWTIVKQVFSEPEISQMRENVQKTIALGYKGDLLSNPFLHDLVYEPRILDIVRALIGDSITYFGDSAVLLSTKAVGWHKDNPDRNDENAPDWKGIYDVVRVGVYLEDHTKSSGGLLLRDKSHTNISINFGRPFNVPTQKGDVVVWYLKTTHSGNAKLLRFFPGLIINPKYYKVIPGFIFKPEKIDRMALAFTYGAKGRHLDRFVKYLKSRLYAVNNWKESVLDKEVLQKAEQNGLHVSDLREEIMDIDTNTLNVGHKDITY